MWGEPSEDQHISLVARGPPPRVWGERRPLASRSVPVLGPSPRVWGERGVFPRSPFPPTDHPHACRENVKALKHLAVGLRTIPTRVGRTTMLSRSMFQSSGPSPRVWGELLQAQGCPHQRYGPSPRVWGEHIVNTEVWPIN